MNEHQFKSCTFDWLTELVSTDSHLNRAVSYQHIEYNLPPEIGYAEANVIKTKDNISLFSSEHHYKKNEIERFYNIGQATMEYEEDAFQIGLFEVGNIRQVDYLQPAEHMLSTGDACFYHCKKISATYYHDTHKPVRYLALGISISLFCELFGKENVYSFLGSLSITQQSSLNVKKVPAHIVKLFKEVFDNHFEGEMRERYIQAKTLEFLCQLIMHYTKNNDACEIGSNSLELVHQLHEQLEELHGKLPTLDQLAKQVGLSQGMLSKIYTDEYGQSIHSFIQNKRISEAHSAIRNSNVPLKVLASRLGYSHVNHFITAFKREYGYPPGSLRKV